MMGRRSRRRSQHRSFCPDNALRIDAGVGDRAEGRQLGGEMPGVGVAEPVAGVSDKTDVPFLTELWISGGPDYVDYEDRRSFQQPPP